MGVGWCKFGNEQCFGYEGESLAILYFYNYFDFRTNNVYGLEFVNCGSLSFLAYPPCIFLLLPADSSHQAGARLRLLSRISSNSRILNEAVCR